MAKPRLKWKDGEARWGDTVLHVRRDGAIWRWWCGINTPWAQGKAPTEAEAQAAAEAETFKYAGNDDLFDPFAHGLGYR